MARLKRLALVAVAFLALPSVSSAGELRLSIADGRVTMTAKDVTLREILAEWARVGQTRIVNGEKLAGPPLTLELQNVPEAQALDTLLRSAAGYVMAPRAAGTTGGSVYDRIMILASSRPPTTPTAAAFNQRTFAPPPPQTMPMGMATDDDQEFIVPGGNPNMINMNGMGGLQNPGMVTQPQLQIQQQGPMTAPRPGMVPAPPAVPVTFPNPYQQGVQPSPNVPTSPYQAQPGTIVVPSYPSAPPAPATRPGIPQTGRGGGS